MLTYKDINNKKDFSNTMKDVYDNAAIRNSLQNILMTRRGSIPGRPLFGSDLYLLTFDQMDAITIKLAERYALEAISRFEDRIRVNSISVIKNEAFNKINISIDFEYNNSIKSTDGNTITIPLNI